MNNVTLTHQQFLVLAGCLGNAVKSIAVSKKVNEDAIADEIIRNVKEEINNMTELEKRVAVEDWLTMVNNV